MHTHIHVRSVGERPKRIHFYMARGAEKYAMTTTGDACVCAYVGKLNLHMHCIFSYHEQCNKQTNTHTRVYFLCTAFLWRVSTEFSTPTNRIC